MPSIDRDRSEAQTSPRTPRSGWIVAVVICAVIAGLYLYATFRHERAGVRTRLEYISDEREASAQRWSDDLVADLEVIAAEPLLREFLGGPDRRPAARLIRYLTVALRRYRLEGLILYDREAVERYRLGEVEPPDFPHNQGFAREAITDRTPSRVILHTHAEDGPVRVGLAVPVLDEDGTTHGALAIEQDPTVSLYAIVQDNPMLSDTMETLFLRPYGEGVRLVSPLRFRPEWGIGRILESSPADLAGLAAVRGVEGFDRYTDYRGHRVFAVTRWIEPHGWGMVVKIDQAEVLGVWRRNALLFLLALAGFFSASATLYWGTRKALEERRQRDSAERGRRFRSLIEQSRDAIALIQEDRLVLLNPAFRELWTSAGVEVTEGEGLESLLPAKEAEYLYAYLLDATTERRRTEPVEVRLPGRSGQPVDIEIQAGPIAQDGIDAIQLVCRDVTLRKQIEEHLRLMQFTLDNATDMVAWIREDGTLAYVNEAFTQAIGWPREQLLDRPIWEFDPMMDAAGWQDYWHLAKTRGSASLASERVARDGSRSPVDISSRFITYGEHEYICSIARDISDWRRLEEQLHQSQKMEAVGRLAGGVAHDFNNMLTVITGNLELGLRTLEEGDPLQERLHTILKAANSAAELTRKLLAFSRKQVVAPRTLDLNRVLAGLEPMLRPLIGEDVRLVVQPTSDPCPVRIDPSQLEQVLVNLVVNAREAMPQGGGLTISSTVVTLDETWVRSRPYARTGRFVRLSVEDTGQGMDEETIRQVFEPFFTTKSYGSGLGLATVYGIVKQNDGFIEVESAPGAGTTFYVLFPVARTGEDRAPSVTAVASPTGGRERVVLVEDQEGVRELAANVLRERGYEVMDYPDGASALYYCNEHGAGVDLLLTDVILPAGSAVELTAACRRNNPTIRILYMSGYTDDAISRRGMLPEDVAFLPKPFTPDDLVRKVREVLDAEV